MGVSPPPLSSLIQILLMQKTLFKGFTSDFAYSPTELESLNPSKLFAAFKAIWIQVESTNTGV